MEKVLLVEDSPEAAELVLTTLSLLNGKVDWAATFEDASKKVKQDVYDLVLLDIVMPDGDAFEWLTQLKKTPEYEMVPVVFISGKEDVASKITAFSLGAEDYIVKPYNLLELQARVSAKLKKRKKANQEVDRYLIGPFEFRAGAQRVLMRDQDQVVDLTPREFRILFLLARAPDRIFSREEILTQVLGYGVHVGDRTIDTHVCSLRKKLGRYANTVESVPGEGYRFIDSAAAAVQHA